MVKDKIKFRHDINALRAIAVTGVLLFHYKFKYFAGGFSGVDIFFVISGYLMSKIILSGLNKNSFSLQDFYGKRLKRIVPALMFLILTLTVAGFFIYFPADFQLNEQNASSSILFLSNILYWKKSNYFDPASDTNIYLHTWSLSVEWQFYLLYPVALLFLKKLIKKRSLYIVFFTSLTIIIFIGTIIYTKVNPTGSFYLFPTRSWEMLLGGVAFLVEDKVKGQIYSKYVAISGYLLIIVSLIFLRSEMAWPGIFTLLPVLATFLVIVANYNDFKLLKNDGVQLLGKISYSLYLWHWPVYVIAQYIGIELNILSTLIILIISLVLGYISFRFIESIEFKKSRVILAYMSVFLIVTLSLSYFSVNNWVFKSKTIEIANYRQGHVNVIHRQFNRDGCFIESNNDKVEKYNKDFCLKIEEGKINILFIGDSHAAVLSSSLSDALEKKNIHLLQATASGCLPILKTKGKSKCVDLINYIYRDFIFKNRNKIDGVILSANWINAKKGSQNDLLENLNNTLTYLKSYNLKTIIIGQNETYTIPYASIAAKEYEYNTNIRKNYLNWYSYNLNEFLKTKLSSKYIDIYNLDTIPKTTVDNTPYMFDENHFTQYGADITIKKLLSNSVVSRLINLKH
jgi:peptidoglycan/LPS O-acetylase OafA/YrhL